MAADTGTRVLLVELLLSLPLLFFAACLPFHLAWNRRAIRLAVSAPAEVQATVKDVWPPPPKTR